MQKLKSIIVDDEPGNIVTLQELLKAYCPGVHVVGTAQHPVEAKPLIKKTNPDLVFLDVEMPYSNAFTMLDELAPVSFEIIFVTAFNDYAIKAFKYAALDYILKPIAINELVQAVEKASQRIRENNVNLRVESLLTNLKAGQNKLEQIGLPTQQGFYFESIYNILFLEAQGSYTSVHLKDGNCEMISRSLNYFDEILPESSFCRVHHSHIINMNRIKKYFRGRGGYAEMENGTLIEISARKRDLFLSKFAH